MRYKVKRSEEFDKWLSKLKDPIAKSKVNSKIRKIGLGNLGDCKPLKGTEYQLSEFRLPTGKGIRIYFKEINNIIIFLINGGDKSSQKKDIEEADRIFSKYLK